MNFLQVPGSKNWWLVALVFAPVLTVPLAILEYWRPASAELRPELYGNLHTRQLRDHPKTELGAQDV
jgi:hypothetical protein